jgi:hypothetical protein
MYRLLSTESLAYSLCYRSLYLFNLKLLNTRRDFLLQINVILKNHIIAIDMLWIFSLPLINIFGLILHLWFRLI